MLQQWRPWSVVSVRGAGGRVSAGRNGGAHRLGCAPPGPARKPFQRHRRSARCPHSHCQSHRFLGRCVAPRGASPLLPRFLISPLPSFERRRFGSFVPAVVQLATFWIPSCACKYCEMIPFTASAVRLKMWERLTQTHLQSALQNNSKHKMLT